MKINCLSSCSSHIASLLSCTNKNQLLLVFDVNYKVFKFNLNPKDGWGFFFIFLFTNILVNFFFKEKHVTLKIHCHRSFKITLRVTFQHNVPYTASLMSRAPKCFSCVTWHPVFLSHALHKSFNLLKPRDEGVGGLPVYGLEQFSVEISIVKLRFFSCSWFS